MSMITVGSETFTPSAMTWGLQDVSGSDAGRDQNGTMYKNRITQKRKIQLEFNAVDPTEASRILNAFNNEYVSVTYWDPMSNQNDTRNFYVGDRSAPFKMWTAGKKRFEVISFNIIER